MGLAGVLEHDRLPEHHPGLHEHPAHSRPRWRACRIPALRDGRTPRAEPARAGSGPDGRHGPAVRPDHLRQRQRRLQMDLREDVGPSNHTLDHLFMIALTESRKRLIKFILIGMLAVLTDLAMYWVFLNTLPEHALPGTMGNEVLAKALSFLCGLMVTYHLNKRWTWRRKDRSNRRFVKFLLTYGFSLALNVTLNAALLRLLLG